MKFILRNLVGFIAIQFLINVTSVDLLGQTYDQNPSEIQEIERYYNGSGVLTYDRDYPNAGTDNAAWAGKNATTTETQNTFRLIYTWLLDIPTNATVTSATLYIGGTAYSNSTSAITAVQFQIKGFPDNNYNSAPNIQWNAISSSTVLRTEVVPKNGEFDGALTLDQNFTDYIQSSLSSGKLHLSIRGTDEDTFGTNRNVHYIDYKYTQHNVISALSIVVNYTIPPTNVDITAKNIFEYGTIKVGVDVQPVQQNSPYPFYPAVDQTVNLEAQNQSYGGYERVWNDYSPNSISRWSKNGVPGSYLIAYSFQAAQNDDDATYEAGLRKNYEIDQTHNTEFDGDYADQSTEWIVDGNSEDVSAPSTITPNSITYNFAGWLDDLSKPRTRTITPDDNVEYDVLYKYKQHSNDTEAYTNPSQRKIIRSSTGHFHMVYESMGKVWYERSINGTDWELMNDGKPLNDGFGKYPAIEYVPNYYYPNQFMIVFWEESNEPPSGQKIIAQFFDNNYGGFQYESVVASGGIPFVYEYSAPVIARRYPTFLVAWDAGGEIVYRLGQLGSQIYWDTPATAVEFGGDSFSKMHPTIGISQSGTGFGTYRLGWDNGTNIYVVNLEVFSTDSYYPYSVYEAGGYFWGQAGFSQNYQPSISVMPNNDFRLSWIGYKDLGGTEGKEGAGQLFEKRVVTWWNHQFYIFGTNVSSHSIRATDDGRNIIAYGDNDGANNKFAHIWWYQMYKNLNTVGEQIHLSNGSSMDYMYAMSFQNDNLPYSFSMSDDLGSLQKTTANPISSGREAIVSGDSSQFYFVLGDVKINNDVVNYIETGRNPDFRNLDTLNYYLSTKQFRVTNSSQFSFAIQYGVTDSLKAAEEFDDDEYVKFKLQLIKANNGEVLGEYTVVTFNKENIIPYYSESFSINTNGIGSKKIKLRFIVEENINGVYEMANIHADESILPKQNVNMISYTGSETVTEYALEQNYPNPFNPSTNLKYQIPQDGFVTLKVYDILGKEIATLVNEEKSSGRYEVNFNASSLASGVYLYRLNVNDYIDVKKMILLK